MIVATTWVSRSYFPGWHCLTCQNLSRQRCDLEQMGYNRLWDSLIIAVGDGKANINEKVFLQSSFSPTTW